jgi:aminoglycoside phosphotransferase (APT) family kinase protein
VEDALRRRFAARLGVRPSTVVQIEEGWDSSVLEIDGEWIVRVPRRQEVREAVRAEARLLPELTSVLPVAIPQFAIVEDSSADFFVAYRKLPGRRLDVAPVALATQIARFLAALHAFPPERASGLGIERRPNVIEPCRRDVLPLLTRDERLRADEMFDRFLSEKLPAPVLVHADLGPAHILHRGSSLTGVIDWSDACIGDPALDCAWLLNGTSESFVKHLLDAYQPDPGFRRRALFYHRLGPWHEVLYGQKHDRAELVESGLVGIRARLP